MWRNKYVIISIFVVLALIFLHKSGISYGAENMVLRAFSPAGEGISKTANSGKGIFSFFTNIKGLQTENTDLKSKVTLLEAEIGRLKEFQKENESLRKDLGFIGSTQFKSTPAEITMYVPSSAKQMVLINKGEKDGVHKGSTVVSEGVLVGRVVEVTPNTAKVFLITDPTSGVPSIVVNSTATGIVKGQLGSGLALEKIPQSDLLKEGQLVLTSGLGGDFPKGILIGRIENIQKKENEVFQSATIRSDLIFSRLERVFIIN